MDKKQLGAFAVIAALAAVLSAILIYVAMPAGLPDWIVIEDGPGVMGSDIGYRSLVVRGNLDWSGDASGDLVLDDGDTIQTSTGTEEGVVFATSITTTYSITTSVTSVVIPANADVIDWSFVVLTAYNDSGTDLMNCGTATDQDKYVDGLDLSSAGRNLALDAADMQNDESTYGDVGAAAITVNCIYTGQNANASAGAGKFILWYRLD